MLDMVTLKPAWSVVEPSIATSLKLCLPKYQFLFIYYFFFYSQGINPGGSGSQSGSFILALPSIEKMLGTKQGRVHVLPEALCSFNPLLLYIATS